MKRSVIRYFIFSMVCAVTGSVFSYAQQPVPLPELNTKRLLNSLQVIVAPTPYLDDTMAIGLVVSYGASYDQAGKGGVANLLSRMFMKATADKTGGDIQEELAYLGATLEVRCNWDGYQFLLKGRSATFERALLLLYQIICEAQFTEEDFSAEKEAILKEMETSPDPRTNIHEQFEVVLFGRTTYGRPLRGTKDTLKSITIGDLRYFYNRHFSPNASSLIVVGNIDPTLVLQKASRIWGLWIRTDSIPFTFAPPHESEKDLHLIEDDPDSPSVQFILGNLSPRRQDPMFVNTMLAVRILQERLRNLLPTSLLTVGLDGRRLPGTLYVQGQSAADEAVDQILKIQEALDGMKQNLVSAEELALAQNRLIEEFRNGLVTTDGLCRVILDSELYGLGSYYASSFPDRIRKCNADSVRQASRDSFFPGSKIEILRGPVKTLMPELKRLGTFNQIVP